MTFIQVGGEIEDVTEDAEADDLDATKRFVRADLIARCASDDAPEPTMKFYYSDLQDFEADEEA